MYIVEFFMSKSRLRDKQITNTNLFTSSTDFVGCLAHDICLVLYYKKLNTIRDKHLELLSRQKASLHSITSQQKTPVEITIIVHG